MSDEYEYVDHPAHYNQGDIETIDLWKSQGILRAGCESSIYRYVMRAGKKPGQPILRDLSKAKWYLERWIRDIEEEQQELPDENLAGEARVFGSGRYAEAREYALDLGETYKRVELIAECGATTYTNASDVTHDLLDRVMKSTNFITMRPVERSRLSRGDEDVAASTDVAECTCQHWFHAGTCPILVTRTGKLRGETVGPRDGATVERIRLAAKEEGRGIVVHSKHGVICRWRTSDKAVRSRELDSLGYNIVVTPLTDAEIEALARRSEA